MNDSILKGAWMDVKGEILSTWGKLTGDNLDQTKGNIGSIVGLIQKEYGLAKDEITQRLHEISERFASPHAEENPVTKFTADKTQDAKDSIRKNVNQPTSY